MIIRFTTLILIVFSMLQFSAQEKSFKTLYNEASSHLENEEYSAALPILLEMEKLEPKNFNTLSSIGYCYLQSAYNKKKAMEYFDRVLVDYKNLNPAYEFGNHKEKKAPVEVIRWSGLAKHANYKFEDAISNYQEYKELINPSNEELITAINTDIRTCRNAIDYQKHPTTLTIDKLEVLNTEYSEYRPKVNGDETQMLFTSRRPIQLDDPKDEEGLYYEDIYMAKKSKGVWQTPIRIDSKINSDSHDACLYITPDGSSMIIYRTSLENNNEGGIYQTHLKGSKWSEPALMIAEVNSDYWETDANISADGNTLFYTSDKPGGQGGRDIWQMKKLPTGEWAKVQNLGAMINTSNDEEGPYLHPDGKTLYFSSKGHKTMGGFDVCMANLNEDGTWSTPVNLGYPINTPGDDVFYFPTNDGKRAYFSSFREGGQGQQDIYMIDVPSFEMKTVALYKGLAKYSTDEIITDVDITIENAKSKTLVGNYKPNSDNGEFLFILQPGETFLVNYSLADQTIQDTIVVPSEGGTFDILKIITVKDNLLVLLEAELVDDEIKLVVDELIDVTPLDITDLTDQQVSENLNEGKSIVLNDLFFIYDKDRLITESKPDLSKVIKYMQKNPEVNIILEGHTDFKGELDYNQTLSEKRANRVKNKLIAAGIKSSRITTKGFGENKPIAANANPDGSDNPEGRQKNRRVEIKLDK
jgi:outer membrane protein OmpA-like peptidoglycan-associated protein/tetratricopeptide (TPR) repeat protein